MTWTASLRDKNDNEIKMPPCDCGHPSTTFIKSKIYTVYMCENCLHGNIKEVSIVYKPNNSPGSFALDAKLQEAQKFVNESWTVNIREENEMSPSNAIRLGENANSA